MSTMDKKGDKDYLCIRNTYFNITNETQLYTVKRIYKDFTSGLPLLSYFSLQKYYVDLLFANS